MVRMSIGPRLELSETVRESVTDGVCIHVCHVEDLQPWLHHDSIVVGRSAIRPTREI